MGISFADAPADARGAIQRTLRAASPTAAEKGPRLAAQRVARGLGRLDAAVPLPIYAIDAEQLDDDVDLATATIVGWQYLILRGRRPVALAELVVDSDGRSRVTAIVTGPRCGALFSAIERLEKSRDRKLSGELRLLWSPGASQRALWLHSARADRVLPISLTSRSRKGKR